MANNRSAFTQRKFDTGLYLLVGHLWVVNQVHRDRCGLTRRYHPRHTAKLNAQILFVNHISVFDDNLARTSVANDDMRPIMRPPRRQVEAVFVPTFRLRLENQFRFYEWGLRS